MSTFGNMPPSLDGRKPDEECYSSWSNHELHQADKRFTAAFTCPLTGERFASGKLVGSEGKCTEQEVELVGYKDVDIEGKKKKEETTYVVNLIWYSECTSHDLSNFILAFYVFVSHFYLDISR